MEERYLYLQEKEEGLLRAKELVSDAAEALEVYLPSAAQELTWLAESLEEELISVATEENYLADGVENFEF